MTHKATLTKSGSINKQARPAHLADAISSHLAAEKASFHTPGHKGRGSDLFQLDWRFDVTELPGLDELANCDGVLGEVETKAAAVWGAAHSFISVNGASAGIIGAILSCARRGGKILLPRNAHRSVINALILSGLEPVWYEAKWDQEWCTVSSVDAAEFASAIDQYAGELACALIVSPTYNGCVTDIERCAQICKAHNTVLIVDEAHGAHFGQSAGLPPSAVTLGADMVVHSLHKTAGALTQTGILHVSTSCPIDPRRIKSALHVVQSSSPSYLLMASVEAAIDSMSSISAVCDLAQRLSNELCAIDGIALQKGYGDPLHLLVKAEQYSGRDLAQMLANEGIYAEAVLGNGVLLLLGVGSNERDGEVLITALKNIVGRKAHQQDRNSQAAFGGTNDESAKSPANDDSGFKYHGEQVLSPRAAFLAPTETVALADSVGRVAAECVAPCPPGWPVVVPGQRITHKVLSHTKQTAITVVAESNQGEQ